MRYVTIVVILVGLVGGCAYGGPSPGARGRLHDGGGSDDDASSFPDSASPPGDGGVRGDAASPRTDAGSSARVDAGATTHTDAGASSGADAGARVDAGSPHDAGPGETDAGPPPIDLGPGIPGETCVSALDVSAGGTWMVDTCAARDDVPAMCGRAGTPDVVLSGVAPRSGSTYQIHVGAGWVIQQVTSGCGAMPFSCGASDWGVSGATLDPAWLWAVESADGSCGMATISVTRVM